MLIAHGLVVLALDGARMQLLRNCGSAIEPRFECIASDQSESLPTHLMGEDRAGRSFSSSGPRRHAYERDDLHERREREFAATGLDRLARELVADVKLVIIAPPRLLGHLRKLAPAILRDREITYIDKDLAGDRPDQILGFLLDHEAG